MKRILTFIIYLSVNFSYLYLYKVIYKQPLRIIETLLLLFFGCFTSFVVCSFFANPNQFFVALAERITRPVALIYILVVRITWLFTSIFSRVIKLVLATIISVAYGISPIDLIPDFFLGVGQLDDIAVFLLSFYWGLTFTRLAISISLRQHSMEVNNLTKIRTKFP